MWNTFGFLLIISSVGYGFRSPSQPSIPRSIKSFSTSSFPMVSRGIEDETVFSSIFDRESPPTPKPNLPVLSLSSAAMVTSLWSLCSQMPPLTVSNLRMIPALAIAALGISQSMIPAMEGKIDIANEKFVPIFAMHVFSVTGIILLPKILLPAVSVVGSKGLLLVSTIFALCGAVAEIVGHFQDHWVFATGKRALEGEANLYFWTGLTGATSFLGASLAPSMLSFAAAAIAPALLLRFAKQSAGGWKEAKGKGVIVNGSVSMATTAVLMHKLQSWWPILYFVQAFNIIRCSKRIFSTENQNLHLLPSFYGWFSYTIPFALAMHPMTYAVSWPIVLAASVASMIASDSAEKFVLQAFPDDALVEAE